MKKFFVALSFAAVLLPASFSCSPGKFGGYRLNEIDAANAIRELLGIGARQGLAGSFNKDMIMSALFPTEINKALNVLSLLGLTSEVDRFTETMGKAAEKSAERAIPIFISAIDRMTFSDAMRIIRNGGTAATDYLRSSVGADIRRALTPVMKTALDEYKLNEQWDKFVKPIRIAGITLNPDLSAIMASLVSEAMFRKIEEKERDIRANAAARTSTLLQKVFSRDWN